MVRDEPEFTLVIEAKNLSVKRDGRNVLAGINLELSAGETLAIMGASGGGKTTLLRAIVGLLPLTSGVVRLFGVQLEEVSAAARREVRRKVGMLFQQDALFDSMTVAENMGFVLKEVLELPPETIKIRTDRLLERLNLGPIGHKYPRELSGGMKKRVGLARAIAHAPDLLILDDPTAGLDPITADVIADLIASAVSATKSSALIVSNHLPLVTRAAQRVAMIQKGSFIDLGQTATLQDSERPDVKALLDLA